MTATNGTQTSDELAIAAAVQHHVASFKQLQTERDDLQRKVDKLEQQVTVNKIEIEALRAERAATVSRMESYQHERDDAVANLTVYQSLFVGIMAQLRAFGIEHSPLVREEHNGPTP